MLFADDRAKKYGITPLSALAKEKYISGVADFSAAGWPWIHTRPAKSQKNRQLSSCTCTRISNKTRLIGPFMKFR